MNHLADRYPRRQESRPNGLCLLHRSLKVPVVFEGPDTEQSQSSQVSQSSSVSIAMGRVVGKSQIFLHGWKHQDDAARPHEASAFFLQLHWESEAPGWQCEVSSCCFTKCGWQWILVVLKLFTRLRNQLQAHVAWACSMSSAAKLISPNLRVHHQQRPVLLQNQAMFPSGQAPALQHPGARHMRGIHGKVQTNDQVQSVPQALPLRQPSASAAAIQSGLSVLSRTNKPNKKHTLCKWGDSGSVSITSDACKQLALLLLPLLQQQPLAGQHFFFLSHQSAL